MHSGTAHPSPTSNLDRRAAGGTRSGRLQASLGVLGGEGDQFLVGTDVPAVGGPHGVPASRTANSTCSCFNPGRR